MGVFDTINNALQGKVAPAPGATMPQEQHEGGGVNLKDQSFAKLRAGRDYEMARLKASQAKPAEAPAWHTKLAPEQELFFQHWLTKVPPPPPDYDIRGFWLAQRTGDQRAQIVRDASGNVQYPAQWAEPPPEIRK